MYTGKQSGRAEKPKNKIIQETVKKTAVRNEKYEHWHIVTPCSV